jgi:hypothetical protein
MEFEDFFSEKLAKLRSQFCERSYWDKNPSGFLERRFQNGCRCEIVQSQHGFLPAIYFDDQDDQPELFKYYDSLKTESEAIELAWRGYQVRLISKAIAGDYSKPAKSETEVQ